MSKTICFLLCLIISFTISNSLKNTVKTFLGTKNNRLDGRMDCDEEEGTGGPIISTAPPCHGLNGSYFNNVLLDPAGLALQRIDSTVNFDWSSASPESHINMHNYSVRWTGQVQPLFTETYTFYTTSDDGIRLWVNGIKIVDQWNDHAPTEHSGTISLVANQKYDIKIEFYENGWGEAVAQLRWSSANTPKAIVPTPSLWCIAMSTPPPCGNPLIGMGNGLKGEYFNNRELSNPVRLTRLDTTVNFSWGGSSPDNLISSDNFSARWTGQVQAQFTKSYTFYTVSDDGIRLWVNGVLIIDNWTLHADTWNSGIFLMTKGQKYDIKMEFYENGGGATAQLWWESDCSAKQIIPTSQLYASPIPPPVNPIIGTGNGLWGEYFNNQNLSSPPSLTKIDGTVNYSWGGGKPDPSINADHFSVRWTGLVQASYSEFYTFSTFSDDGIRLWIDNNLVINNWGDHGDTWDRTSPIQLTAGQKYNIKIEFYENGGGATAQLWWESDSTTKQVVPQSQLYVNAP